MTASRAATAAFVAAAAAAAWATVGLRSHACEFEPPQPPGVGDAAWLADAAPVAPPFAPVRSEVALATCSLRGSVPQAAHVRGVVLVDGNRHRLGPRSQFGVEGLLPGTHAVTAVWSAGDDEPVVLFVAQLDVVLEPGERRDLGTVQPTDAPWSSLRVAVHERTPEGVLAPDPVAGAGANASAGARGGQANVTVAGATVAVVPLGTPVSVRGLLRGGIEASAVAAAGTADAADEAETAAAELVPGTETELRLVRARAATLAVDATWQPGVHGWLEVHAVRLPDAPRDGRWLRRDGVGALGVTLDARQGRTLVVASQLDRSGRTQAFAMREIALRHGDRVRLDLAPTVRATGRWPTGGVRVEIALQRWPKHPLWRADADADGRFVVEGLPADVPLCARAGGAAPRPLHVERTRDGLALSVGR